MNILRNLLLFTVLNNKENLILGIKRESQIRDSLFNEENVKICPDLPKYDILIRRVKSDNQEDVMKKNWIGIVLAGIIACIPGMQVNAVEIDTRICEKLTAPDYEELGLGIEGVEDAAYSMDVYDGRIYITGDNLIVEKEKKESPVVLIYDEKDDSWSTLWATFLDTDCELEIIAGDEMLYFFDNHYSSLKIFGYNLKTKEVKEVASFTREQDERGSSLLYDGEYVWIIGGEYLDSETEEWKPLEAVRRWNIESGKLEVVEISEEEKNALFEGNTNLQGYKDQVLNSVKTALGIEEDADLVGAMDEDQFYVFGDVDSESGQEQIFYRFAVKDTEEETTVIEETTQEQTEEVVEEEELAVEEEETKSDNEDGITKGIVIFCIVIMAGGTLIQMRHKRAEKKESQEGDEE